jgi:hypothetical protein
MIECVEGLKTEVERMGLPTVASATSAPVASVTVPVTSPAGNGINPAIKTALKIFT